MATRNGGSDRQSPPAEQAAADAETPPPPPSSARHRRPTALRPPDLLRSAAPLKRLRRKREAVRQFTPSWFTCVMGTGSVALTIATFPYAFAPVQQPLSLAVWVLAVALFFLFAALFTARFLFFPETIAPMARHPAQSLFLGAIPMAFSTLTNGFVLAVAPYAVAAAGDAAARACAAAGFAMFWINVPMVALAVLLVPWFMFTTHDQHQQHNATALYLLPVVPACVAAGTAGTLVAAFPPPHLSPRALESVLISGLALGGVGLLLSLQVCTIYFQRLLFFRLPPRVVIVSSFLPVGPMAMVSLALVRLGAGAEAMLMAAYTDAGAGGAGAAAQTAAAAASLLSRVPPHPSALPATDPASVPRYAAMLRAADGSGLVLALALWGFALWWLAVAIASVGTTLRTLPSCGLGLWGGVFPVGVLVLDTAVLAQALDVPALRGIAAGLAACHWLMWIYVMALTVRGAWTGALFVAPCLAEGGGGNGGGGVGFGLGSNILGSDAGAVEGGQKGAPSEESEEDEGEEQEGGGRGSGGAVAAAAAEGKAGLGASARAPGREGPEVLIVS